MPESRYEIETASVSRRFVVSGHLSAVNSVVAPGALGYGARPRAVGHTLAMVRGCGAQTVEGNVKILIADKFPSAHVEHLEQRGHRCIVAPDTSAETLPEALGDAQALVVRSTRVTASALARGPSLEIVVRAGTGINTIDVASASAHGVDVCNVPGRNALAVAELTLGLILALDRRIADNVAALRAGQWDKKRFSEAAGLHGRRIGIVGLGAIGLAVAERARAFGFEIAVVAKSRSSTVTQRFRALDVREYASLELLVEHCDIVTFHLPATVQSKGLVDAELLQRMRPGAMLINTSRGDLMDEAALLAAIDAKDLRVGLDVYADEPATGTGPFACALAAHPNVYGTHHIGASTDQAQDAVADGVLEILFAHAEGRSINCVNRTETSPKAAGARA